MSVAFLLSCEPPLRPNKALPSPKKLGPCARTRTRNAQVVQKASLSLTPDPRSKPCHPQQTDPLTTRTTLPGSARKPCLPWERHTVASIQLTLAKPFKRITPRLLPDLPDYITGTAFWRTPENRPPSYHVGGYTPQCYDLPICCSIKRRYFSYSLFPVLFPLTCTILRSSGMTPRITCDLRVP